MPLKKESILKVLDQTDVALGTLLALIAEDGVEPGEWEVAEKEAVVGAITSYVSARSFDDKPELSSLDIARSLGAIREAELRYQEQVRIQKSLSGRVSQTTRIDLGAALESRFLADGKLRDEQSLPVGYELLFIEACLENAAIGSLREAQGIHDLLLETLKSTSERTEQYDIEYLGRCLALVAKQVGALSVTDRRT